MLIKKRGHILFIFYSLIFKALFRFLCKRNIIKHLVCVEKNGMCPLFLMMCASVFSVNLGYAGTDILQNNDEIRYAIPRDAIPAIKDPEYVSVEEAGLDDLVR